MEKLKNQAMQMTKEIVVKFVETGRITPTNFTTHFAKIYLEVLRTLSEETLPEGAAQGRDD